MKTRLLEHLVGGPRGDPALYVELAGASRSLLVDLGDLSALTVAQLQRVTDCFVSHTHIDHFYGFDRLLRANIATTRAIRVHGPAGIVENVAGKLAGYYWNLFEKPGLAFHVTEATHERFREQSFQVLERFRPENPPRETPPRKNLVADPTITISWALVDHGIPCLAFSIQEADSLNVDPARLAELGIPPGPWVGVFKEAAARGDPPDLAIDTPAGPRRLGEIRDRLLVTHRGKKIAYATDTIHSERTAATLAELARGADTFYCEHYYMHEDRELAARNRHLTARQAGEIARAAGARELVAFHFSPRYEGRHEALVAEGLAAFRGNGVAP